MLVSSFHILIVVSSPPLNRMLPSRAQLRAFTQLEQSHFRPVKAQRDVNYPLWPYPLSFPKTFTLSRLDSLNVSDRMRFLSCSVCEEDGGVIKGTINDKYPFLQFVLAIGLDDSSAVESHTKPYYDPYHRHDRLSPDRQVYTHYFLHR